MDTQRSQIELMKDYLANVRNCEYCPPLLCHYQPMCKIIHLDASLALVISTVSSPV